MISGRPELRAWAAAWSGLLRLVCVAVAALGWRTPTAVLVAYAIGAFLGAVVQGRLALVRIHRAWGRQERGESPVSLKRLLSFGAGSSTTTSLNAIKIGAVSAILGRSAGAVDVGLLNIAMLPVVVAAIATAPFRMTTFPEMARLSAEGRDDVLRKSIRSYTLLASAIALVGAAIGWFVLPVLIRVIFSSSYAPAVRPARVLLVAAIASISVAWAKALPAAIGRPWIRTAVSSVELVLTVIGVSILASRGVWGAAVAISIATSVVAVMWVVVAQTVLRGPQAPRGDASSSAGDER
jgi:O-antigen/teichoic acid export membrane protein